MKVLSLFSGVGGFDMGLENAGMETVFQCEWDKHANSILYKHWPDVPKWDDVSTLTGKHILAHAPVVDVVAWGSPCQDLSVAGARKGLDGERSGLFHEGIRIIKELQEETNGQYPRISIWENVVGAITSNNGNDFGVILDEMAKAGALVQEWSVLDAQYFGIPQRRRRVFLLSAFCPAIANNCPNPILPVAESLRGNSAKGKPKVKSAATTLTEGTGTDGGIVNAIGASIYHKSTVVNQDANAGHMIVETNPTRLLGSQIIGSLNATDYKWPQNQQLDENKFIVEPTLTFDTQFGSNANVTEDIAPTLKSSQQSPSVAYPIQDGRDMEKHQNGFGVSSDGEPSYTLDRTGAQSVAYSIREDAKANNFSATELDYANSLSALQPSPQSHHAQMFIAEPTMAVRRLTPLECERLMGWPDDHTRYRADGTEQVDTHRYKQCGNGVASPVAQWIAKHILAI